MRNSTQRRPRLEGAAKVRPEASRWRAKMAAPAQYPKFCRCAPKRFRATLSNICLAGTQAGFTAHVQTSVGEQLSRACIGAHYLIAAFCIETTPLPRQVFTGPAELPLCTALIRGGSISRIPPPTGILLLYLPGEQTTTVLVDLSSRRNCNLRHPGESLNITCCA